MVTSCWQLFLLIRDSRVEYTRVIPERKDSMSSNPGDDLSPHRRETEVTVRMANAFWASQLSNGMRFIVVCNDVDGMSDDLPQVVLDCLSGEYMTLSELQEWLPVDLRERVRFS